MKTNDKSDAILQAEAALREEHEVVAAISDQYDASAIQILSSLQAIRHRAAMYVGQVDDATMLNRFVQEAMCLAVDEVVSGHCTEILVSVANDCRVTVRDNGRGLSMVPNNFGDLVADHLFSRLYACREHKENCGLKGTCCVMGMVVVNALSEWFRVRNFRDGKCWVQEYQHGEIVTPFVQQAETTETGLELSFRPDPSILTVLEFDPEKLSQWVGGLRVGIEMTAMASGYDEPAVLSFRAA